MAGTKESGRSRSGSRLSQADEIKMMQDWLAARRQPRPDPHAHHAAGATLMPGMLTPEEMARLSAARGPELDRLFLELAIKHHGALVMVKDLLAIPGAGQEADVFAFASGRRSGPADGDRPDARGTCRFEGALDETGLFNGHDSDSAARGSTPVARQRRGGRGGGAQRVLGSPGRADQASRRGQGGAAPGTRRLDAKPPGFFDPNAPAGEPTAPTPRRGQAEPSTPEPGAAARDRRWPSRTRILPSRASTCSSATSTGSTPTTSRIRRKRG